MRIKNKVRPAAPYLVHFVNNQFDDIKRSNVYWFVTKGMNRLGVCLELFNFGNLQGVDERLKGFEGLNNGYLAFK